MNVKVNKPSLLKLLPMALISAVMVMGIASCNKKDDDPDDETATIVYLPNVAVTSFKLKADKNVMANLDSVFFTIDLEHGVIYNADSLPKGTPINKLVPSISYSSYITSASIIMKGGTTRNDTVNYVKNPGDSIDFTGNVSLVIATANDEMKKTYTLKVNVHKQEPDSLVWNEMAVAQLPSRLSSPRNQKTVELNGTAVTLIEEKDGSLTISTSSDLYNNVWTKNAVTLPFQPEVRSLTASSSALYLLDSTGSLYTSADGLSWTSTGEFWNKIIGGYGDTAIGLKTTSSGLCYAQYPLKNLEEKAVDTDFPIGGHSNFVVHSNKWTSSPVGFFCGGEKADGSLSDAVWAFDGSNWIPLSEGSFPAMKGASLIPYYAFRTTTSSALKPTELEVWMILGGETSDGSFNRTLYISYDNGVNWRKGDTLLQLPDVIPAMTECDNIVLDTEKDTQLSDAWKVMASNKPAKVKWNIDGNTLYWDCPFIYLIGGFAPDRSLYDTIWRGALNRLQDAPII
ncbi:MAG: hypothetical protein K2H96_10630 [Muribaculaceae bacterium]|nr:hypothetical protein [Muribaculaceae bacterium]